MKRRVLALLMAVAMIGTLFAGCARPGGETQSPSTNEGGSGEEPIKIIIGHTDSSQRSTHKWSVWLGEYLEEKAPGRFVVEVHSDGGV